MMEKTQGSLSLNRIFSDYMVMQRDKEVRIWGTSKGEYPITVSIGSEKVTVHPVDGRWQAVLPPMTATVDCEMLVSCPATDEHIIVRHIAIGEVWIAGGQSNMEFPLKFDSEAGECMTDANNSLIRFYDTPKLSYVGQEEDEDFSEYGFWRILDSENAPFFSAVGFYFAQQIFNSMNVPVGIVGCNWGGTTASAWVEECYLADDKDLAIYLRDYEEATKNIDLNEHEEKFKQGRLITNNPQTKAIMDHLLATTLSSEEQATMLSQYNLDLSTHQLIGPKYFNRPAGVFHSMVKQIAGYSTRGVIWYQGESDDNRAEIYDKLFSAVIRCWRETWEDELPFLFVQLAPFRSWFGTTGKTYPILRERQEQVSKTVPKTFMASIMDAGMEFDIHPKRKKPVGERLALLARGKVYGEDIICEAPEVRQAVRDGSGIRLEFLNVGEGLSQKDENLNGLQILVNGEELSDYGINLELDQLTIMNDNLLQKDRVEIQFAWTDYVEVNLYNSVGLPAKPFKLNA